MRKNVAMRYLSSEKNIHILRNILLQYIKIQTQIMLIHYYKNKAQILVLFIIYNIYKNNLTKQFSFRYNKNKIGR